jgi:cell division transport system permease protein
MRNWGYVIKEGFKGFRQAPLSTIFTVLTFFFSVLLVGVFLLLMYDLNFLMLSLRERLVIEAFVDNSYTEEKVVLLGSRIEAIEGVSEVVFISSEEAASFLTESFDLEVLSVLEENPLPRSLRIQLLPQYRTSARASQVVALIKKQPGIDDVIYRHEVLQKLEAYFDLILKGVLIAGLLVSFAAVFFIYNTIRLIIASRGGVIQIMKLVGATPRFIRLPFLLEGVMQAILGTSIAIVLLYLFACFLNGQISQFELPPFSFWFMLSTGGVLLGWVGSALAVQRFLNY